MAASKRPALLPKEGSLSDGRQVLHFRPTHWSRHKPVLEVTRGELPREEGIQLWCQKRQPGRAVCPPQWQPPAA